MDVVSTHSCRRLDRQKVAGNHLVRTDGAQERGGNKLSLLVSEAWEKHVGVFAGSVLLGWHDVEVESSQEAQFAECNGREQRRWQVSHNNKSERLL